MILALRRRCRCLLLIFPIIAHLTRTLSETTYPAHQLSKRAWVLECSNDPLPSRFGPEYVQQDSRVGAFRTLTALCTDYSDGVGIACNEQGGLRIMQPPSRLLFTQLGRAVLVYCQQNCHCVNIGPDQPAPLPERPDQCSEAETDSFDAQSECSLDSYDAWQAAQRNQNDNTLRDNYVACDGRLFGHPSDFDCQPAHQELHDLRNGGTSPESTGGLTDFHEAQSEFHYSVLWEWILPDYYYHGTCNISLQILAVPQGQGGSGRTYDFGYWSTIDRAVERIRQKCVIPLGQGGWTWTGEYNKIGVYVYAQDSEFDELSALRYNCRVDEDGREICDSEDDDYDYGLNKLLNDTHISTPSSEQGGGITDPSSSTSEQQCGGSCAAAKDCDLANNFMCASDKDIPVSSTWGTFKCRFMPDAVAVLAAAEALQVASVCRGRCLLDAHGEIEVYNSTNSISAASPSITPAPLWFNSTSPSNATFPSYATAPDVISPINGLTCPCNCTYVSQACCLSRSGMVWEAPSLKIDTVVQAPNGSVCCDTMTGDWALSRVVRDDAGVDPACSFAGLRLTNDTVALLNANN